MSHCQAALLSDRGVLRVTGADAGKFLQGIITSDLDKTEDGGAIHTGLLSPQGKILFDFFVAKAADGFLLEVAADKAADLAKRLAMYRLRAKVDLEDRRADYRVFALWGGAADAD